MVSIIITAYNVQDYIRQAIESALNQTFLDLEVVVVLDKPTDDTTKIVKSIQDPRLVIVENEGNVGPGLSRRIGLQTSKGEYTLLLDGDDWIDRNFIEKLYNRAIETDADIVSGGIIVERGEGAYDATSYGNCITEGVDKVTKFWGERIVFMNNKLIKRHLHDKVPYCHRRFIEDTPVIVPQLWLANKVAYIDCIGYHYRMLPSSLTHTTTPFKTALYRVLCWFDLIDFFVANGKEVLDIMSFKANMQNELKILQGINITDEMIKPYMEDWLEYSKRLLKYL